ncbi:MAG: nucleotidyl transferase AbiEii/AbiGii toxin family protein [Candidatus Kryptoniota bacterium]
MKKDIKNLQASVRARLQNKAKEANSPFLEILQYYGMERFLYRVSCSKFADKFILKGALMFTVWQVPERRTTLDIDFLANYNNQVATIEKIIKDICDVPVIPDGLVFDAETVKGQRIKEEMEYEGVRVKFIGLLGRSRIPMQIDFGFGDAVYPAPKIIDYPVILDFPEPHLRGYPPESMVSEKFEAMVRLGLLNSRMKDFYDIWLMMHQFNFNGLHLVEAIKRTFNRRKTPLPKDNLFFAEEIYDEKSDRQTLWRAFLKKSDIKLAPERLSDTAREIKNFLMEPINSIKRNYKFHKIWDRSGIWK